MSAPIKIPARFMFANPAPLLEEEGDLRDATLISDASNPSRIHRPRARTALSADD